MTSGERVTGEARTELASEVRRLYDEESLTVNDVATKLSISYGKAHKLLKEAGGVPRSRGSRGSHG